MNTLKTITIICFLGFTLNLNAWFIANETNIAFNVNTNVLTEQQSNPQSLDQTIAEAAGHFLKSTAYFQLFLEKVEIAQSAGIDNGELLNLAGNAIAQMEAANEAYSRLIAVTGQLSYNTVILDKLAGFDYTAYRKENRLNSPVFKLVETYLKSGDVRGCYAYINNQTLDILARLKSVKDSLDNNPMPDIQTCWRINQLYLETTLFGQYTAEVFISLR